MDLELSFLALGVDGAQPLPTATGVDSVSGGDNSEVGEGYFEWIVEPLEQTDSFWSFLQGFDFSWYACSMGLGITAILLDAISPWFPETLHSSLALAARISHWNNIVLFSTISGLTVVRYGTWPRLFPIMMKHHRQASFVAMMPIALATIITMWAKLEDSDGETLLGLWVFWWIDVFISLLVAFAMSRLLSGRYYAGRTGGYDVAVKFDGNRALITIWVSYGIWILGIFNAFFLLSIDLAKLRAEKKLRIEHLTTAFVPLITTTQGALAAQQLGERMAQLLAPRKAPDTLRQAAEELEQFESYLCDIMGRAIGVTFCIASLFWLVLGCVVVMQVGLTGPGNRKPSQPHLWVVQFSIGAYGLSYMKIGARNLGMGIGAHGAVIGGFAILGYLLFAPMMAMLTSARFLALGFLYDVPEVTGPLNRRPRGRQGEASSIEVVISMFFADGLSRHGSHLHRNVSQFFPTWQHNEWGMMTEAIAKNMARMGDPVELFPLLDVLKDRSTTRMVVSARFTGYVMRATGWFDYLCIATLLAHVLIAHVHTIWNLLQGQVSEACVGYSAGFDSPVSAVIACPGSDIE
ncbi:hypothetical protein NUW58_g2394 [Xylaria curta]|uniref:Uncharacterized protein n=1 Tax=Xylaria curta TaxID=42375 RepID=A0ACC1PFS0_9PEZI|nr:hypothetical protein NUW58_g2394 [Xylaria curta]